MEAMRRKLKKGHEWKGLLDKAKKEFNERLNAIEPNQTTINDFNYIKTIGKGKFGKVMLYKSKASGTPFAIKVIIHKYTEKNYEAVYNEREILRSIYFPFTIHLESYFYHHKHLYLVLPFVECGDLFKYLKKKRQFDESVAKFYAGQILLALEYLHYLDIVYRDLKPENILLDSRGYIRLSDFGLCKRIKHRTYTFCGTPEYIAPEVISCRGYGKSVDYWAFGVLVYELITGISPFCSSDERQVFERIMAGLYIIKSYFSADLKDLLQNLLQQNVSLRYGNLNHGAEDIKDHKWFKQINWLALFNKEITPPNMPCNDLT